MNSNCASCLLKFWKYEHIRLFGNGPFLLFLSKIPNSSSPMLCTLSDLQSRPSFVMISLLISSVLLANLNWLQHLRAHVSQASLPSQQHYNLLLHRTNSSNQLGEVNWSENRSKTKATKKILMMYLLQHMFIILLHNVKSWRTTNILF